MVINITTRKQKIIVSLIIVGVIALISFLSISIYIGGLKYNRLQYCLKLYGKNLDFNYLPSYDKAIEKTVEESGEIMYYFASGDWYAVSEELGRVIYFENFSHQIREYNNGKLTSMMVERVRFNGMPTYDDYQIT